eukprot:COSAG01_NODE_12776_length_1691_cov_33.810453_2_plen_214_part_00
MAAWRWLVGAGTVWVGGIPEYLARDEGRLVGNFAAYGALDTITVRLKPVSTEGGGTPPNRSWAFVAFEHADAARSCMQAATSGVEEQEQCQQQRPCGGIEVDADDGGGGGARVRLRVELARVNDELEKAESHSLAVIWSAQRRAMQTGQSGTTSSVGGVECTARRFTSSAPDTVSVPPLVAQVSGGTATQRRLLMPRVRHVLTRRRLCSHWRT